MTSILGRRACTSYEILTSRSSGSLFLMPSLLLATRGMMTATLLILKSVLSAFCTFQVLIAQGVAQKAFVQMKPSYSTRLAQCPFCKTPNYAVEYRGAKTKEEKGVEQVEEQLVIEAQIRMQQQELQNAKGKLRKKEESSSSRRALSQAEVECQDVSGGSHSVACFRCSTQYDEAISSQRSCIVPISERPSHSRQIGFVLMNPGHLLKPYDI